MYEKEFLQIAEQALPKALLLYGENEYGIEKTLQRYITTLDAKDDMLKLYFEDWDFEQAKNYLSQGSLFGGVNLLIIRNDKVKNIKKQELEFLIETTMKNENNYLIYVYYGDVKNIKETTRLFNKKPKSAEVRFFPYFPKDNIAYLEKEAKELGVDIDHHALTRLIDTLEDNLALALNELKKFTIFERKVGAQDVDDLVYSTSPLSIEQLLLELFNKSDITLTLQKLLELGEDEINILRSTQAFVYQLFLFQAYIKLNGYINANEILGYNPPKNIVDQKANLANRIKSQSILKIAQHLLNAELQLSKAKTQQKEALIYTTLSSIQTWL
ncbi:MAG: DNA polymerase III subunit delta [Campylobacterales bacterium]|nr:DNA polymerase III subunit delta [Campylobacterales bacterium]